MTAATSKLSMAYGRVFERSVVVLLLSDEEFKQRIGSRLDHNMFETGSLRAIIEEVNRFYTKSTTHPTINTLITILTQKRNTVVQTSEKDVYTNAIRLVLKVRKGERVDQANAKFTQDRLHEFITRQAMLGALITGAALHDSGQYNAILSEVDEAIRIADQVLPPSVGIEYSNLKDKQIRYNTTTQAAFHCPLMIPKIDAIMRGGMEPGKMGVFMGPSSRGKTLTLVHAGAAALRAGKTVVHITLEVSDRDVELRYDANISGIPINTLVKDHATQLKRVKSAILHRVRGKLFIKQWGCNEASTQDVIAYLHMLRNTRNVSPHLVLIDYADLLRAAKARDQLRFELSEITRTLSQIAKDFNCAVWTASQTNRSAFSHIELSLQDAAECIDKVQIADVVIGLCQSVIERKLKRGRLIVLKNRLGGNEGLVVGVDTDTGTQKHTQSAVQLNISPSTNGTSKNGHMQKAGTAMGLTKSGIAKKVLGGP